MVEEILLRIADPAYRELQLQIAEILEASVRVSLIDDSVPNPDFMENSRSFEEIISLSQDIAWPAGYLDGRVSFFKISRVFDEQGSHLGWFIPSVSSSVLRFDSNLICEIKRFSGSGCCVVDSDIASGSTKQIVSRLFPGAGFYAPIQLKPHQDLLDVEDLVLERSLMWKDEQFGRVSYLTNKRFFCSRTSLSVSHYRPISQLMQGIIKKTQNL